MSIADLKVKKGHFNLLKIYFMAVVFKKLLNDSFVYCYGKNGKTNAS